MCQKIIKIMNRYSCLSLNNESLVVYDKKYHLQVHLDNRAFKTVNKEMTDHLDENLFED